MNAQQFTPGPWRWWSCKDGSYNPLNDYAQIAAGPQHVAQVRIASTTEADLRLIASAPDMLAALQLSEQTLSTLPPGAASLKTANALEAVRKAIAGAQA